MLSTYTILPSHRPSSLWQRGAAEVCVQHARMHAGVVGWLGGAA